MSLEVFRGVGVQSYELDEQGNLIGTGVKVGFSDCWSYKPNLEDFFRHLRLEWETPFLEDEKIVAFKCINEIPWIWPKVIEKCPTCFLGQPIQEKGRNFVLLKNGTVKFPLRHYDFVFDKNGNCLFGSENDFFAYQESAASHEQGYHMMYDQVDITKMCRIKDSDYEQRKNPNFVTPEDVVFTIRSITSFATLAKGFCMLIDSIQNPLLSDEQLEERAQERGVPLIGGGTKEEHLYEIYLDKAEEIKDFSIKEQEEYLNQLLSEIVKYTKETDCFEEEEHPSENITQILARMIVFAEHEKSFPEQMKMAYEVSVNGISRNITDWQGCVLPSKREFLKNQIVISPILTYHQGMALMSGCEKYVEMREAVEGDINFGNEVGCVKIGINNQDSYIPLHLKLLFDSVDNLVFVEENSKNLIDCLRLSSCIVELMRNTVQGFVPIQPLATDGAIKVISDYIIKHTAEPKQVIYSHINENEMRVLKPEIVEHIDNSINNKNKGESIDVFAIVSPIQPLLLCHHESAVAINNIQKTNS